MNAFTRATRDAVPNHEDFYQATLTLDNCVLDAVDKEDHGTFFTSGITLDAPSCSQALLRNLDGEGQQGPAQQAWAIGMDAGVSSLELSEKHGKSSAFDCGFDQIAFGAKIDEFKFSWEELLFSHESVNGRDPILLGYVVFNATQKGPVKFFTNGVEARDFANDALTTDYLFHAPFVMSRTCFKKFRLACPEYAAILRRIRPVFQDNCSTYDLKEYYDTLDFLCTGSVDLNHLTAVALALLSALAIGKSGNKRDRQLLAVRELAKKRLLHDDCLKLS